MLVTSQLHATVVAAQAQCHQIGSTTRQRKRIVGAHHNSPSKRAHFGAMIESRQCLKASNFENGSSAWLSKHSFNGDDTQFNEFQKRRPRMKCRGQVLQCGRA